MSTHPITLRHRVRQTAAVAVGLATLGGSLLVSFPTPAGAAPAKTVTIKAVNNKTWGKILEEGNGKTVYRFDADPKGKSTCNGKCAQVWPPVLASKVKAPGLKGFSEIKRAGGVKQVAYEGIPLYTFIADKKPLMVTGNTKDSFGQWATINPAHPLAKPVKLAGGAPKSAPTTQASGGSSAAF